MAMYIYGLLTGVIGTLIALAWWGLCYDQNLETWTKKNTMSLEEAKKVYEDAGKAT